MFTQIVDLYRASNRPAMVGNRFDYSGPATPTLLAALEAASKVPQHFGRFSSEPAPSEQHLEFSWLCGSNEHGRFYADINALVANAKSLSRGTSPANCYLVGDNYCFGERPRPQAVERLDRLCELIRLLEQISLIADSATNSDQPKSLIFVLPAGDGQPPKTLQLVTQITAPCLTVEALKLDVLRQVVAPEQQQSLNAQEYRSLFRLAVADVISRAPIEEARFHYLVEHWTEVLQKYEYDVDCFIKNFSFDKLRLEISQNAIDFSAKLTTVMGDNTSKFLALPVPLLAVAAIVQAKSMVQADLVVLGALAVACVFSGTTKNQFIQLRQVDAGFSSAFDKLKKSNANTSPAIKAEIDSAIDSFGRQRVLLKRVLWFLRISAWIPPVLGTALVVIRFYPPAKFWLPTLP